MTFGFVANLLGGLGAVACVGLIPLWVLGVPGTMATPYAEGWMKGFQVLWMYPVAFLANLALFAVVRWLGGPTGSHWAGLSGWVSLALLLTAILRLSKAWRTMP